MARGWFAIQPPLEGTLDADIRRAVATLLGGLPFLGTIDADTKKPVSSLVGSTPYTGQITAGLDPALANLVGAQVISSTLAAQIKKAVFAATGGQTIPGILSARVSKAVFSGNGSAYNDAVIAASTTKVLAALSASQIYAGTIDADFAKVRALLGEGFGGPISARTKAPTASLQGSYLYYGNLAVATKKLTAALVSQQIQAGSISVGTKKVLANISGTQTLSGSLAVALKKLAFAGEGGQAQTGTAAMTLKKAVAALGGSIQSGVTVNSIGTPGINTTSNQNTKTAPFNITVNDGTNRLLLVTFTVGLDAWIDSWGSVSCTSSLDGALTQASWNNWGNNSGYRQAGLATYVLQNPSVGTHTITPSWSYWQGFDVMFANAICFDGVGSYDAAQSASSAGGTTAQTINVPNDQGDMVVATIGAGSNPDSGMSGDWPSSAPGLWFTTGGSYPGEADYIRSVYVQGDGNTKTFTGPGGIRHGIIGLCLNKA